MTRDRAPGHFAFAFACIVLAACGGGGAVVVSPPAPAPSPGSCGAGTRWNGSACVAVEHCREGDVADCTAKCDQHDPGSCTALGLIYTNGTGVTKDEARATELFKVGCDG